MSKLAPLSPGSIITSHTDIGMTSCRLDLCLCTMYGEKYSRSLFQKLIIGGHVSVNGTVVTKPSFSAQPGQTITIHVPPLPDPKMVHENARNIPIEIVFSHEHFLVLNKPAHVLVHSPRTNSTDLTVVDWLLAHFADIQSVGGSDRPGIIHRLDKDTSGLLLVARNQYAHAKLSELFKNRLISKTYVAVVKGHPSSKGVIDFNIIRHPIDRIRMSHSSISGRQATTHYTVREFLHNAALIEAQPLTGRTHQIRVHCAAIGHPIIGDALYHCSSTLIDRQALHAYKLSFMFEGQQYSFCQEPPADFQKLVEKLRKS